MTFFSLVSSDNGEKSLSVMYADGELAPVSQTHPNFDAIHDLLLSGEADDESVKHLVNTLYAVGQKLAKVSERVTVAPYGVFFDGDPLRGELADTIVKLNSEGNEEALIPLINFLEKVKTNPSITSVDDLYRWVQQGDFLLAPNGDLIGYKAVDIGPDGVARSVQSGTATVNGEVHKGQIPYPDGAVVEMPRSEVDPSSSSYCSTGLHVGTYDYTKWFRGGANTVLVQFNPRDAVSVPSDHNNQKLRVCRYVILGKTEDRVPEVVYSGHYAKDEPEVDDSGVSDEDYLDTAEDTAPDTFSVPATGPERDEKGRFKKGSSVSSFVRDAAGRFKGKKN